MPTLEPLAIGRVTAIQPAGAPGRPWGFHDGAPCVAQVNGPPLVGGVGGRVEPMALSYEPVHGSARWVVFELADHVGEATQRQVGARPGVGIVQDDQGDTQQRQTPVGSEGEA